MNVRPTAIWTWAFAAVLGAIAPGARGEIVGRIVSAGFGANEGALRLGCWTPVWVELDNPTAVPFEGTLLIEQADRDGDHAQIRRPVSLQGASGPRQFLLYALPQRRAEHAGIHVKLLDARGRAVAMVTRDGTEVAELTPQSHRPIDYNHRLILDLSPVPVGALRVLERDVVSRDYPERLKVAHMSARRLPRHWYGLEAADVVVWDRADPTGLEPEQRRAVVRWVRKGGRLVIGVGAAREGLMRSELGDLLPVQLGAAAPVPELPVFQHAVKMRGRFDVPVNLCGARLVAPRRAYTVIAGPRGPLVSRAPVGAGLVTCVACPINELLSTSFDRALFFEHVIGLTPIPRKADSDELYDVSYSGDLFDYLQGPVGFTGTRGALLGGAMLFAMAYIVVAVFGCWWYLKHRRWEHQSWLVFAAFAGCASVGSIVLVQASRGVTNKLHQLSVIDGQANSFRASGRAYFGLRTPTHTRLETVTLDGAEEGAGGEFLRPLPAPVGYSDQSGQSFIAPTRYRMAPTEAELGDIEMRATVKQFEGTWSGQLARQVRASLVLVGDRVTGQSWIQNDLATDLEQCYLVYTGQQDIRREKLTVDTLLPVYAFRIGAIPAGSKITGLDKLFYFGPDKKPLVRSKWPELFGRNGRHHDWSGNVGRALGNQRIAYDPRRMPAAMMLLTTWGDLMPERSRQFGVDWERKGSMHTRWLDRSEQIQRDTALLVGLAYGDPGPIGLAVEGRPLTPSQAITVYRFAIPVHRRADGATP